jgi:hypothetical protein
MVGTLQSLVKKSHVRPVVTRPFENLFVKLALDFEQISLL